MDRISLPRPLGEVDNWTSGFDIELTHTLSRNPKEYHDFGGFASFGSSHVEICWVFKKMWSPVLR